MVRYSAGKSNNILGPGNGEMADFVAHRIHEPIETIDGIPRYWTDQHHDPRQHWPLRDRGGKEIPGTAPTDAEIDAINGVLQSQSGMYNNGYLGNTQGLVANVEAGPLLPGQARKVWPRDSAPGKGGLEAAAGQFVLPGFKQEIPQISTGPYTGGAVGAPIGTYKGGSFAVPLPYYG